MHLPNEGTWKEEGIRMKRIGLGAVALFFLVNANLTFARSPEYQAYELLNMLEYLYPQYLAPALQITRLDEEGAFYRRYSDTGIVIRTKQDHLYLDDRGGSYDLGLIGDLWFPFVQSEILFNWLEIHYPDLFAPAPQATQVGGAIFYRAYPETNTAIGTFGGDLYALDGQYQLYSLGRVDFWLGENLDFGEALGGVYTIQQKSTMRYVDAFETSTISHDYNLVTRGAQNDDTQRWIITPVGNNAYTIQQKSTMRYVDAFETSTISHDYNVVTRGAQNDDTQRWILTLFPEDVKFLGIEYDLDAAEISTEPDPVVVATERLENNSPLEQTMSFQVEETYEEESYFERTEGFEVEVGTELTAGVPYLEASASIRISTDVHWTSGQAVVRSHAYTAVFPLRVEPYGAYRATARVWRSTLSVPYVMFFESNETGAIRVSRGMWSGVSTWGLECVVTPE
jgi:hypothetical protein